MKQQQRRAIRTRQRIRYNVKGPLQIFRSKYLCGLTYRGQSSRIQQCDLIGKSANRVQIMRGNG